MKKEAILLEVSSKKTMLLITKTRVFAIFEKIVIGLNSQNRLFQERGKAEKIKYEMKVV